MYLEPPNINVNNKTNEQNMQIVKTYMTEMTNVVNNFIATMTEEIADIKTQIAEIKGTGEGE